MAASLLSSNNRVGGEGGACLEQAWQGEGMLEAGLIR